MCIKATCHICGTTFPTTDLRRRICDSEECHAAAEIKKKQGAWRKEDRICAWCGGLVPMGSGRRKYCCRECQYKGGKEVTKAYKAAHREQTRIYRRNSRMRARMKNTS